jgi:thiol-disulfide isomerase/thioredoxin/outer membrane lipoprotein-sorting protein
MGYIRNFVYIPNMKSVNKLKKLAFTTFIALLPAVAQAQTGEEILSRFYKELHKINVLQYTIHRTDTFVSGKIWQKQGEALMIRDSSDKNFPFKLYGKDNEENVFIFDGQRALTIFHPQGEFAFETSINYRNFVGHPAGRVFIHELLLPDTPFDPEAGFGYNKLTVDDRTTEYILTFYYSDSELWGIKNQVKTLTIDKKTWIPISGYHKFETPDGEKQVNIFHSNNIRLNNPAVSFPSIDTFPLKGYREIFFMDPLPITNENLLDNFIDMELKNTEGTSTRLSAKKGKVVLLAFWETWCGPCIESIPKIKRLISQYPADAFEVWGIVSDEKTFAKVPSIIKRTGINYNVYFGTQQTTKDYQITAVPKYVIIDKTGTIVFVEAGFTDHIEKKLEELLR